MISKKLSLINAFTAQGAWWICVLSAKTSPTLVPLLATTFVFLIHFTFVTQNWRRDLKIFSIFTIYGAFLDTCFIYAGIYILPSGHMHAPIWLICLWSIYATNLEYSLHWVAKRPALGAALGALFGPLSYAAGSTFDLLILKEPQTTSIALSSLMWALSTPFVYAVLERYKKEAPRR